MSVVLKRIVTDTHQWRTKAYWEDINRNRWDADQYREEEAALLSLTLIECTDCVNCRCCSYCKQCENCQYCSGCERCVQCGHCMQCTNCHHLDQCMCCLDCSNSEFLEHCITCDKCRLCVNLEYKHNAFLQGQKGHMRKENHEVSSN